MTPVRVEVTGLRKLGDETEVLLLGIGGSRAGANLRVQPERAREFPIGRRFVLVLEPEPGGG